MMSTIDIVCFVVTSGLLCLVVALGLETLWPTIPAPQLVFVRTNGRRIQR